MSGDHSACEVKVQAGSLAAEEVDRLGNVVESSGIAAARLVGAPIAKAPGGDTLGGEVGAEMAQLLAAGTRQVAPAAAMDKNGDRERSRAGG